LAEKLEGKSLFGRLRYRWDDNFKMDLKEVGCKGVNCIKLVLDRVQWWALVNTVMNLWVP